MPVFEETIPNVTIALGRDLTLPCTVSKLGNYRVSIDKNLKQDLSNCGIEWF